MRRFECPKCRFGGGAVCWSRPVPYLAALRGGTRRWRLIAVTSLVTVARNENVLIVIVRYPRGRDNALTLSCKNRPPRRPPSGGAAAAATNAQRRERTAADRTAACRSEPPRGGAAPPARASRGRRAGCRN